MENITLPNNIKIELDKDNGYKGALVVEPLFPGYGPTIANSLRRILLSSLPGAAIYAFKIKGVQHEFTAIGYIKEDVVDISLNLKRIKLKSHSEAPVRLELKATGAKKVTAADIAPNSDIEIANPKQLIATLTDKAANLEMTLWVRPGRGYQPVENQRNELEVNAIAIDSIFSPVEKVGYQVENVRVGDRTDYDKVIMQIETNGTVSVAQAVSAAAQILAGHFGLLSESLAVKTTD